METVCWLCRWVVFPWRKVWMVYGEVHNHPERLLSITKSVQSFRVHLLISCRGNGCHVPWSFYHPHIISDGWNVLVFFRQSSLCFTGPNYSSSITSWSNTDWWSISFFSLGVNDGLCLAFLDGNPVSFSWFQTVGSQTLNPVCVCLHIFLFLDIFLQVVCLIWPVCVPL